MRIDRSAAQFFATLLLRFACSAGALAQAQAPGLVQPWGLPPLQAGIGPVEKFADVSGTPQGQYLEGGAFDAQGNLWFVAIGSGWGTLSEIALARKLGRPVVTLRGRPLDGVSVVDSPEAAVEAAIGLASGVS